MSPERQLLDACRYLLEHLREKVIDQNQTGRAILDRDTLKAMSRASRAIIRMEVKERSALTPKGGTPR